MSFQPTDSNPLYLLVQLEILPEQVDDADLALVSAVGRDTIDELQHIGYQAHLVPTGKRGGDVLVDVVTTLTTIATNAWANKEIIERVITDIGSLVTVCTRIVPLVELLRF